MGYHNWNSFADPWCHMTKLFKPEMALDWGLGPIMSLEGYIRYVLDKGGRPTKLGYLEYASRILLESPVMALPQA